MLYEERPDLKAFRLSLAKSVLERISRINYCTIPDDKVLPRIFLEKCLLILLEKREVPAQSVTFFLGRFHALNIYCRQM